MHDAIYANQERWNGQATGDPRKVLREIATSLGVAGWALVANAVGATIVSTIWLFGGFVFFKRLETGFADVS